MNMVILLVILIVYSHISIITTTTTTTDTNDDDNGLLVATTSGIVKGHPIPDIGVNEYLGIPYAEPPIGELRFARPVPLRRPEKDIIEVKDKSEGVWCYQNVNKHIKAFEWFKEDEDCLHLNVWAPERAYLQNGRPYSKLKPVVIILFPGGFSYGSAYIEQSNGSILATYGIVAVSLNYRIGPLGMYMLDDDSGPGNVGFYDQNLAFKWVQQNIRSFGGDPNMVTIYGVSAGSFSVSTHIVSPLSRGLFKRAIMSSGALIWNKNKPVLSKKAAMNLTRKLAINNNCPLDKPIAPCLRAVNNTYNLLVRSSTFVVIDFTVPNEKTEFCPQLFNKALKYFNYNRDIELMAGSTRDEGPAISAVTFPDIILPDMSIEKFGQLLERMNDQHHDFDIDKIIKHYTSDIDTFNHTVNRRRFTDIYGDVLMRCPTYTFAKHLAMNGERVYYYDFNYFTKSNPQYEFLVKSGLVLNGSQHGLDADFHIGVPLRYPDNYSEVDKNFTQYVMEIWTNFIKFGYPGDDWPVMLDPRKSNEPTIVKDINLKDRSHLLVNPYADSCEGIWKDYFW
ncbi:cholinesterase 1-like [Oppia nitens]|uniref:cholinesterase 1-like n=1 Tax=Oppia nitens TaxID=1686743 RepID=UPI0023D9DA04|nr:cholinesterase 1-like [Oppia nitens]